MQLSRRVHRHQRQKKWNMSVFIGILLILITSFAILFTLFQPTSKENSNHQQTTEARSVTSSTISSANEHPEITWQKQGETIKFPILMYHAIHVMAPEEAANANLIVDPTTFESHLKALQDAGYYTLSPEEAYKVLTENVLPVGKKVVWLTFDDSLWDFYSHAYPLLKQYQMKATNNVITGFTENGNSGNLTIEQMKEMHDHNLSFQSHTVNHPDLEYSTIDTQNNELVTSKTYLDTHLSQQTIAIAYPAGRYSSDTITLTEQAGYKLGLTTNNGLASTNDGLLTLNRVRVLPTTTAESLLAEISQ